MAPSDPAVALSIGIVAYNRRAFLDRCLDTVQAACVGIPTEVIVVDNASTDGTVEMLRQRHAWVHLIANPRNVGLARAGNQSLMEARGRYFLFLNDDTEVAPDALRLLIQFLETHPAVGAVGPTLLYADGTEQGGHKAFPTPLAALFGRKSMLRRWFPKNRFSRRYLTSAYSGASDPYPVDSVSSACILLRREALDQVGGMDEQFFVYWSDVDWCRRLRVAAWSLYVVPRARIVHFEGQTITKQRPRTIIDFHRGAYRYYCKHDASSPWHPMRGVAVLGLSVRTLVLLAVNLFRPKAIARPSGSTPERAGG